MNILSSSGTIPHTLSSRGGLVDHAEPQPGDYREPETLYTYILDHEALDEMLSEF